MSWSRSARRAGDDRQPLRAAEFDALFANALFAVETPDKTTAVLRLDAGPGVAARARDLAAREARAARCSPSTSPSTTTAPSW